MVGTEETENLHVQSLKSVVLIHSFTHCRQFARCHLKSDLSSDGQRSAARIFERPLWLASQLIAAIPHERVSIHAGQLMSRWGCTFCS